MRINELEGPSTEQYKELFKLLEKRKLWNTIGSMRNNNNVLDKCHLDIAYGKEFYASRLR